MTHPRISVSALSSVRWSFEEDLALWRDLGTGWAGLMAAKLADDIDGRLTALAAAGIRASTAVVPRFDLSAPATWVATREALRRWTDAVAKHDGWSIYLTPGRPTGAVWEQVLTPWPRLSRPASPTPATRASGWRSSRPSGPRCPS